MNKLQEQINNVLKNNGTLAYEYSAKQLELQDVKVFEATFIKGDAE